VKHIWKFIVAQPNEELVIPRYWSSLKWTWKIWAENLVYDKILMTKKWILSNSSLNGCNMFGLYQFIILWHVGVDHNS